MEATINQTETIKVNYCSLLHRPTNIDFFSVDFKYKSNGNVLSFEFNVAKNCMTVTTNKFLLNHEIHSLQLNEDLSQLIFSVTDNPFKAYCLIANSPIEKAIFKAINLLHNKGLSIPVSEKEFTYENFSCRTKMGKIEFISLDKSGELQDIKTKVTQIAGYDFLIEMMREIIQTD